MPPTGESGQLSSSADMVRDALNVNAAQVNSSQERTMWGLFEEHNQPLEEFIPKGEIGEKAVGRYKLTKNGHL